MTRLMYDSVSVDHLPTGGQMYAGYVDGHYRNFFRVVARFPGALHVPIAVFATTNAGVVLDVELGDATPAQAPGWVRRRRLAGVDPTVYCSESLWSTVRAAFQSAGEPEPHWWIAHYDGVEQIPAGAVAKQFRNSAAFDTSVVADHWPGVDAAPISDDIFEVIMADPRFIVRWRFRELLKRPVPDEPTMQYLVKVYKDQGLDGLEGFIQTSDEGKSVCNVERVQLGLKPV